MDALGKTQLATLARALLLCACTVLGVVDDARSQATIPTDHSLRQAQLPVGMSTQIAPKFLIEFSPSARWAGPVRWKYNHANAPASLAGNKAAIIAQLQASFDKWTTPCAIQYVYDGETTIEEVLKYT